MNFLQLVQTLKREAGVPAQITTVQNQTGEVDRLVNWVAQAYLDICLEEPLRWDFLRGREIKQLTAGVSTYHADDLGITNFAQWDTRTMRIGSVPNMADETFLTPQDWQDFYDYWMFGARRQTTGRPITVAVGQTIELHLGPIPEQNYYLSFEYEKQPTPLTQDTDVPLIPSRFHMLIVWRALRDYGMYESAAEVVARAEDKMNEMMFRLMVDQTPAITTGETLC